MKDLRHLQVDNKTGFLYFAKKRSNTTVTGSNSEARYIVLQLAARNRRPCVQTSLPVRHVNLNRQQNLFTSLDILIIQISWHRKLNLSFHFSKRNKIAKIKSEPKRS